MPWGWFAYRFGYKKILLICFVSKIVFWKATGFWLFLLERLLLAIALSSLSGCDSELIYLSMDKWENSDKVFGKYNFYNNSGFLTASIVSGFIINISMELAAFSTIIPYGIASVAALFLVGVNIKKVVRQV